MASQHEREIYFIRAVHDGLRDAMREDERVVVLGEDVDRGVVGATRGLIDEFGAERVLNTPISEATFVGACVGAAAVGLRPVADLMVSSFFYVCMDQIANQAARLPYMSGGQIHLPLVYLCSTGPSSSAGAQHSESPHPMLMNVSGLKIVFPSTARDAKGLMLSAIRDPNPVVYLIDAVLNGTKGSVPEEPYAIPLGVAEVKRPGSDVTVVAIGSLVGTALQVAKELEMEGLSVEVVDPRTLIPFDRETVLSSVRKTGRLVVCDSARLTCSAASEIVAMVAEVAWPFIKAAPLRVARDDVPTPFSPVLEQRILPNRAKIRDAILTTFGKAVARL